MRGSTSFACALSGSRPDASGDRGQSIDCLRLLSGHFAEGALFGVLLSGYLPLALFAALPVPML